MNSIANHSITFNIHKRSVKILIDNKLVIPSKASSITKRSSIKEYSYRCQSRMRLALDDVIDNMNYFTVLSYPGEFPLDGRIVKKHLVNFKKWMIRQGVKDWFWGIEFQERGAVHINVLTDIPIDKTCLSWSWYRIVGSGDPRHLAAGTGIEKIRSRKKAKSYLLGYSSKREQKDVPENFKNVGRFWGCSRRCVPKSVVTRRFKSFKALQAYISPVVEFQKARYKEWFKDKEKPKEFEFRGIGFMLWDSTEFIENLLMEGGDKSE